MTRVAKEGVKVGTQIQVHDPAQGPARRVRKSLVASWILVAVLSAARGWG